MPDQQMPSSSPVWIATCTSPQGSVTGTTPNRVRNLPAVGKVNTRRPFKSASRLMGFTVLKLQGSQEPELSQVTFSTSSYASFQISFSPYLWNRAGTSRL